MKHTRNINGFTLFELVTVIAVIYIIVLISSPFLASLLKQNEANKLYYSLKPILTDARTQAYSLHHAIGLCGSNNGTTCNDDWNKGILTFLDHNQNRVLDADDQVLAYHSLSLKYGALTWRGAGLSRSSVLLFESERGRLNMSNGSFWYCAEEAKWHRLVILATMGHSRPSKDSNGDGIHETASGVNISC